MSGSNVNGAIWGTGFVPPAVPSTVNPTPVWRGTFTMPATSVMLTVTGNGHHFLWTQHPLLAVTTNGAPAAGGQAIILVPAPGGAVGIVLGLLLAVSRRRHAAELGRSRA